MDHLFINVHDETLETFRQRDPALRFGLDGTRYAGAIGFNWPELLKSINYVACYSEPVQAEIIRDYQSDDCKSSSAVGYDTHDKDELWAYMRSWWDLIRGLRSVFYYASSGFRGNKPSPFHRYGLVAEDLDYSHSGEIHINEIKEIKKGIDSVLK